MPAEPSSPLPRRVLVAGTSGAGKSTLAGRLAVLLGIPHTELDGLYHGPGWTRRPAFVADVERLVAGEAWVTEWQYRAVRPLLLQRAEMIVWLDLPLRLRMRRVVVRTLRRRVRDVELWNGNREPRLRTIVSDQDHIIRWAWRTRHQFRGLPSHVAEMAPHLTVVRLRSQEDVERWLAELAGRVGRPVPPPRRDADRRS